MKRKNEEYLVEMVQEIKKINLGGKTLEKRVHTSKRIYYLLLYNIELKLLRGVIENEVRLHLGERRSSHHVILTTWSW